MASGYHCVIKPDVAEFEPTPGGVAIQFGVAGEVHRSIQEKLRILRLFKDGNIVLHYSFLYHVKDTQPGICNVIREYPVSDRTCFTLVPSEVAEAQAFLAKTSLPLPHDYLHLGFKSFERSYEVHDVDLAYLSLMIGLEAILNPGGSELSYRISRNAAVLLGRDCAQAKGIFKEVKQLYEKRSRLVHTGKRSVLDESDVKSLRHYLREAIKEAHRTGMTKKQLMDMLNESGFGQRPCRSEE